MPRLASFAPFPRRSTSMASFAQFPRRMGGAMASFAPISPLAIVSVASFVAFLPTYSLLTLPFWRGWVRSSHISPGSTAILAALTSFARLPDDRLAGAPSDRPEMANASNNTSVHAIIAAQRLPQDRACVNCCSATAP
jgi:hypothetical protein